MVRRELSHPFTAIQSACMSHIIIIHYGAFAEILKGNALYVPAYHLTKDH